MLNNTIIHTLTNLVLDMYTKPSSGSQASPSMVQAEAPPAGSTHATGYIHLWMPAGCWPVTQELAMAT